MKDEFVIRFLDFRCLTLSLRIGPSVRDLCRGELGWELSATRDDRGMMRKYEASSSPMKNSPPRFDATEDLPQALTTVLEKHRPSRMPFFRRLADLPHAVASDPQLLGQIH